MRAATPEYETTVLTEFSEKLQAYCGTASRGGRGGQRIVLMISVVTAAHVDEKLRARLAEFAGRILSRDLPAAQLDGLYFAVDPAMTEPQCHIGIDDREPAAPAGREDLVRYPPRLLTLAFGAVHRFVFPLVVGPAWLAVRRGRPADLRYEISLPEHFNAVPAGTLLQLRYEPGRVELRRTAERTEYIVTVDGVSLAPGQSVELGGGGWITYANGSGRSALRYILMERQ